LETIVGLSVLTSSSAVPASEMPRFYKTSLNSVDSLRDELAKSLRHHESRRAEIKQLKFSLHEMDSALKFAHQQEEQYKQENLQLQVNS